MILCKFFVVAVLSLLPFRLTAQPDLSFRGILSQSSQMVVVMTGGWTNSEGLMRRFERSDRAWQQVGPSVPVVLGSNGLGWGRGLPPPSPSGPQKKAGDGRSPAGIFRLTYAFGYAPADEVPEIKLPYVQCTESVECVMDTASSYFNIIMDRRSVAKVDWSSSEKMRLNDDEHKLGVFVAHNTSPADPEAGSCVFMCIWKEPVQPTDGNTAMRIGDIERLLGWLDPRSSPVLVQLPREQYRQEQIAWMLPAIEF
jgi:D-alanyl-D-alanine dipeptidase